MFIAMNRQPPRPVQSLRTPVNNPKRGGKERPAFKSPHRKEDERALQRVREKRQQRENQIPAWANERIAKAKTENGRSSRASSNSTSSRPAA